MPPRRRAWIRRFLHIPCHLDRLTFAQQIALPCSVKDDHFVVVHVGDSIRSQTHDNLIVCPSRYGFN